MYDHVNGLVKHITVTEMVSEYETAMKEIDQARELLKCADKRLGKAFDSGSETFHLFSNYMIDHLDRPEKFQQLIDHAAWRQLIEKMNIKQFMSSKKIDETERAINAGKMGEISTENITNLMRAAYSNVGKFAEEALKETFDILRPRQIRHKTNTQFDIGKKVILTNYVDRWYGGKFRVSYYYEKNVNSIDIAFHNLANDGVIKGYRTPLLAAINAAEDGIGETKYYKFKCYLNGNLHLEFKRMDLVKKLNAIAGGNALYQGEI